MPVTLPDLLADLAAETQVLDDILAGLPAERWETPTPAAGWAVRDQVSHLAYFDETATLAATDPDRFRRDTAELTALGPSFPDEIARRYRQLPSAELLTWFRHARQNLLRIFGALDAATRTPWYGPDMSVATSVTARLMETWAHGQDIADAVGITREPTDRLRHIAHLGIRTFAFSFQLRKMEVPRAPVRVGLDAPDGTCWHWGPADAVDRVTGPALDFCLLVTQRRNLRDTALRVDGPVATQWMSVAQVYAGSPGSGRAPGAFRPATEAS